MTVRRFELSPSAWIGLVLLATFVVLGIVGPWVAPYDVGPTSLDLENRFAAPSTAHWLGTDSKGADALSQLMWGARSGVQFRARGPSRAIAPTRDRSPRRGHGPQPPVWRC